MSDNTGSAILMLGLAYLYFVYNLSPIIVALGIGLATFTWAHATGSDKQKQLWEAQKRYYIQKAEYYRRKTLSGDQ